MGDGGWKGGNVDPKQRLQEGSLVTDYEFDAVFSPEVRRISGLHWTPVSIAQRAAKLLVTRAETRVLDIGSGPGKFCIVGALSSSGLFFGVEQRRHLYDEANRVVHAMGVSRVEMIHGNMSDLEWNAFDAFYLYNPFFENIADYALIDQTVSVSVELFQTYIDTVSRKLEPLAPGTRVATYHGFGGAFPAGYHLAISEQVGSDSLNVWVKA